MIASKVPFPSRLNKRLARDLRSVGEQKVITIEMRRHDAGSFGADRISDGLTTGTLQDITCLDSLAVQTDFMDMNLGSRSPKGFDLLSTTDFVDREGCNVLHQCQAQHSTVTSTIARVFIVDQGLKKTQGNQDTCIYEAGIPSFSI